MSEETKAPEQPVEPTPTDDTADVAPAPETKEPEPVATEPAPTT